MIYSRDRHPKTHLPTRSTRYYVQFLSNRCSWGKHLKGRATLPGTKILQGLMPREYNDWHFEVGQSATERAEFNHIAQEKMLLTRWLELVAETSSTDEAVELFIMFLCEGGKWNAQLLGEHGPLFQEVLPIMTKEQKSALVKGIRVHQENVEKLNASREDLKVMLGTRKLPDWCIEQALLDHGLNLYDAYFAIADPRTGQGGGNASPREPFERPPTLLHAKNVRQSHCDPDVKSTFAENAKPTTSAL